MKMSKINSSKARNVINNYFFNLTKFNHHDGVVKLRTECVDCNYYLVVDCTDTYNVIYKYPISLNTYNDIRMHVEHIMRLANYMNNNYFYRDNSF